MVQTNEGYAVRWYFHQFCRKVMYTNSVSIDITVDSTVSNICMFFVVVVVIPSERHANCIHMENELYWGFLERAGVCFESSDLLHSFDDILFRNSRVSLYIIEYECLANRFFCLSSIFAIQSERWSEHKLKLKVIFCK